LADAIRRFREVCSQPIRVVSLSDWVSNIALFIPLGYLLTAAFGVDRPRVGPLVAAAVVAGCALFSASIEFLQLFFPPRVSSLDDVAAEALGAAVGALAWLTAGRPLTEWARRDTFGLASGVFPAELLPCCVLLLAFVQLLPLDLSLQPAALYHKYKEGRARLASFVPWPGAARVAYRELSNLSLFVPIGVLFSGLGGGRWREWAGWRRVFGLALVLVGAIKSVQLFVLSRNSYALDVVTGALAILLGWALGVAVGRSTRAGRRAAWGLALCAWVVVVAFLNWSPFDFSDDPGQALRRLGEVPLLPFADYVAGSYLNALDQLISRLALFLPAGLLLPEALGWETDRAAGARVVLAVAVWAAMIEIGQAFLPTRYPSLTDVLVESLGAWFGYRCAERLRDGGTGRTAFKRSGL
jgi:VanZ family protein